MLEHGQPARMRATRAAKTPASLTYMVTRPRHTAISELWIMPTDQA